MLIEVITFGLPDTMTRADVMKNYADTTQKWANVEELVRKSYLYDEEARLGGGVYHWKSVEAADKWHGAEWKSFVKDLYGNEPAVKRFEVPIVVDNTTGQIEELSAA